MKPEHRRQQIFELLMEESSVGISQLAERLDVSLMTVHRDLDRLEQQGLLRKDRGRATIEPNRQFESDFRYRGRLASHEKTLIAARAAEHVEPGSCIIVDDGTTSLSIAPFLIERAPLTVITNNLPLLTELSAHNGIQIIALGGDFSMKFNAFFGQLAERTLTSLRADLALLSTSAIEGRTAFHQDRKVLSLKRHMMQAAAASHLVVDHQKFGRTALHRFADLDQFDSVITTNALASEVAGDLVHDGIRLTLVDLDGEA